MDAASIESMNKVRKSLGLPLLPVPGASTVTDEQSTNLRFKQSNDDGEEPASTLESREAAGFANFKALQDEERRRIEREQRKKKIQSARDRAARNQKLEGKGLVDASDELDTKAWLKGYRKNQKEIQKTRQQQLEDELAERERLASVQYTEADLGGVQVAHGIDDFDNVVGEQILTLQDQEIGKDGDSDKEDILENSDLAAMQKVQERLDLKKKKAYDVNEDQQGLLSQYDDKKRKAFTLDGQGGSREERESKRKDVGEKLKTMINLDSLKPEVNSDYQEIKIKKPKKIKKNKRQKDLEQDDIFGTVNDDEMQVDAVVPQQRSRLDADFNDDDDLANALSAARKGALKKRKNRPENIVEQIKKEREGEAQSIPREGNGTTFDDTVTFLDNIVNQTHEEEPTIHTSVERGSSPRSQASNPDEVVDEAYAVGENEEELLERLQQDKPANNETVTHSGLEEEKPLEQGLGATLNLLKQRGLVKELENPGDKNKLYRDRQKFIIEARLREHENEQKARLQRERDRQSGRLQHMSVREREEHARWQNTQREHQSSVAAAAAFNKEYKPDVQIKYVDDEGRLMNQKEAFKHLSHQFHGKGSGKGKTEKHLKKIADEKRRDERSVLDVNADMARGYEGAAQHQRKGKQAGVRLQ